MPGFGHWALGGKSEPSGKGGFFKRQELLVSGYRVVAGFSLRLYYAN